ncbi:sugar phosphate nucleotidyltransferase [Paenibacillus arenosi]|uniref:NTP transferase domain-containing protein n=1 Tax=Paenibacillus arenosi TaxID=2774142 RepID=A0ABR9AXD9_9BACL|nr:sugar phosphate nucleotidyltransferase [Paenibacillus arenosi]MBD8498749.1 NTP transferase domain-containing protein [Paenibacillus arenosi]
MKAVIMAGGKGTRLRPLTLNTPKPMVPLLNRPCMAYIIDLLKRHDIHQIAVTLQYLPDSVRDHFGDGSEYGVQLVYFEEDSPLGTAGSVKNAEAFLDETFIVVSGDALTDFNLRKAIEYHRSKQALATMVLTQVDSPLEYGVVMTESDGRVTRFLEKPSWSEVFSDTVNTGIYVLEPSIFNWIPDNSPYDFSLDLFPTLLQKKERLYGYTASGYWSDIGNLTQYRQSQFDMLDRKVSVNLAATEVMPGIYLESDVKLPSRIHLNGPAYIASGCKLHPASSIGPYTVLGEGNTIHSSTKLERTIMWNGNYVGEHSELQDSLMMNRIIIGSGAQLDEGCVIGSGCTIGSKATIRSNVRLWPNKTVPTNTAVHESLIWSNEASKPLFTSRGIVGIPNVDIHPDRAGKLGAAYGYTLPNEATVIVANCSHTYSSLLKDSFVSGLRSVGVHVVDIGICADEVTRHAVRNRSAQGAVHIKVQLDHQHVPQAVLSWMDGHGWPIAKSAERKIENAYFQEDYVRCHAEAVGSWRQDAYAVDQYLSALAKELDFSVAHTSSLAYVLQLSPSVDIDLVQRFSAAVGGRRLIIQDYAFDAESLAALIQQTHSDVGIYVGDDLQLQVVTRSGSLLSDDGLMHVIAYALERTGVPAVLGVPASFSIGIEEEKMGRTLRLVRTKESLRSVMEATAGVPFCPLSHRLYAIGLLLQLFADENSAVDNLLHNLPESHTAKEIVQCGWHEKGILMRKVMEWVRSDGQQVELLDGIRISGDDGTVLIMPDADEPLFQIYAHANNSMDAERLAHDYASRLFQSHQTLRK